MNPQQALNMLDAAVQQMALSRQDHMKLQEAVQVLLKELTVNAKETEKEPE